MVLGEDDKTLDGTIKYIESKESGHNSNTLKVGGSKDYSIPVAKEDKFARQRQGALKGSKCGRGEKKNIAGRSLSHA